MAGSGIMDTGVSGIGGLLYKNPGYSTAWVDQGTQDLAKREGDKATSLTDSDYEKKLLYGAGPVSNVAQQNTANALGGPHDASMDAALQMRSDRAMNFSLNQLQRQARAAAPQIRAQQMKNAMAGLSGIQAANNQSNMAKVQSYLNNQRTRSSIISTLFGGAGSVAGFMGGGAGNTGARPSGAQGMPTLSELDSMGPMANSYEGDVFLD